VQHLSKYGYHPTKHTPGRFRHETRPVTFALVVDDFGVKYVDKANADHLVSAIQDLYTCTTDWTGSLYCALALNWDYQARTCDTSMPGYIAKALTKFCHTPPTKDQHSPHAWTAPTYGAPIQLTAPTDLSPELPPTDKTKIQEIIGTLLYYGRAVDSTILVALGSLASTQAKSTQATADAVTQLLDYCTTHPDAVVRFHASKMQLNIHSDASYLSEINARSRAGGLFFLSDPAPSTQIDPDSYPPHSMAPFTFTAPSCQWFSPQPLKQKQEHYSTMQKTQPHYELSSTKWAILNKQHQFKQTMLVLLE
jgi:hypothetical protein